MSDQSMLSIYSAGVTNILGEFYFGNALATFLNLTADHYKGLRKV